MFTTKASPRKGWGYSKRTKRGVSHPEAPLALNLPLCSSSCRAQAPAAKGTRATQFPQERGRKVASSTEQRWERLIKANTHKCSSRIPVWWAQKGRARLGRGGKAMEETEET